MKRKFTHEFEDCSQEGSLSFDSDPSPPVKIQMKVEEDGDFWVTANREGWLHLARICAELGLGDYEDGYHFHVDKNFAASLKPPEFSFLVDNRE